jgi:hypothetical protein
MKPQHEFSFWDLNRELLLITEFNKLHSQDTTKNKEKSSKLMWAIYFAYNPESKFFNIPDKLTILAKDLLKDPKFNWDSCKDVVSLYKSSVLTDAERALVTWGEIITMRDESLKALYKAAIEQSDTDELVKLDKMLANTPKLFEDYKKIKKDYEEEKVTKKGKHNKSLTEAGEI